jgi:ABC-2 type transport system permease protein
LPSPERTRAVTALWGKEVRELLLSRAFGLLLVAVGLLVGHGFITAVETYAEMSGAGGGPAALPQGMSPLDGILVPTFGAYDLAATLLLPFVVIRCFGAERASGGWAMLVQSTVRVPTMLLVKLAALLAAWAVALVPGLLAVVLWRSYGGHVDGGELATLLVGHLLRAGISMGIAAALACIAPQPATAAVATLAVTVGLWALDFVAATSGGMAERFAAFGPAAALRQFEQGLVRASTVSVLLVVIVTGLAVAGVWSSPGRRIRRQVQGTVAVLLLAGGLSALASQLSWSWDLSEDQRHSFSPAITSALRAIPGELIVEAHLAPEDPRLADLRRGVLSRLERVVKTRFVQRGGGGRTGLFAHPDSSYGEIWYTLGERRVMERSTIDNIVVETVLRLAGQEIPTSGAESTYYGYSMNSRPRFAALLFFLAWPVAVLLTLWRVRRAT